MRRLFVVTIALGLLAPAACSGGDGGGGSSVEAYCDAIREFQKLEDEVNEPDIPPDASFDEQMQAMRDTFEPLKDRIADLRDAAPADIRGDIQDLADAAEELLDVFLSAESLEDLTDPALAERMTQLQEDVEGAQGRVAEFTKKECGIDLTEDETTAT